jgi:hypothetical protein
MNARPTDYQLGPPFWFGGIHVPSGRSGSEYRRTGWWNEQHHQPRCAPVGSCPLGGHSSHSRMPSEPECTMMSDRPVRSARKALSPCAERDQPACHSRQAPLNLKQIRTGERDRSILAGSCLRLWRSMQPRMRAGKHYISDDCPSIEEVLPAKLIPRER